MIVYLETKIKMQTNTLSNVISIDIDTIGKKTKMIYTENSEHGLL